MGSLTSRPKVPAVETVSTVQYVPVSTTASAAQSVSAVTESTSAVTDETQSTEESASEQRTSDLLRRSRGRAGTILTGFRGLLENSDTTSVRKSLLGE